MRFTAPSAPNGFVRRDRLLLRPDLLHPKPMTLVIAPAGYGKSVLMSQWAERQRGRQVRWLTLTDRHDDARRLAVALQRALEPVGARTDDLSDIGDSGRLRRAVETTINRLDGMPTTTLVLDNYHRLTEPTVLELCETLLTEAPPWLDFVIIGQADPSLPYHRAELSDALVELRQDALAFSGDEAAELLRGSAGFEIGATYVERLVERTEGWPVGLEIAAGELAVGRNADSFVEGFDGDHPAIAHYFEEHVLRGRAEGELKFMRETSVLDRMSGPLCDAVIDGHHSQVVLEELERQSAFVSRVDRDLNWFRYHRLFRTTLKRRLRDAGPEMERALLQRAADWHLQHDDVDIAISYLATAGAWDRLLHEVHEHSGAALLGQQPSQVVSWVEHVDPALKAGRTDILTLEVIARAFSGLLTGMDEALDMINTAGAIDRGGRLITDLAMCYRSLLVGSGSDEAVSIADRILRDAETVSESEIPQWLGIVGSVPDVTAAARIARGLSHLLRGDLAPAMVDFRAVPTCARGPWRTAALGLLAFGDALRWSVTSAEDLANQSLAIAADLHLSGASAAPAMLAIAVVCAERDDVEQAERCLAEAERLMSGWQWPVFDGWVVAERAQLALATGTGPPPLPVLSFQRPRGATSMPPLVRTRMAVAAARDLIASSDPKGALDALQFVRDEETTEVLAVRARILLEAGDFHAARALVRRWPDHPDPRARMERSLWSAILHDAEGDRARALDILRPLVTECEIEQIIGLFRDAGPSALALARVLYRQAPTAFLRQMVERPLAPVRRTQAKGLVVPLTDREYAVLALLPTRLSYSEMADRLGVSRNTLKTHLKHIYRKFNAVRRGEVISVAERLHLL